MDDRVIEPSEIIVEQPNGPRENITHVNPWIRFLARFIDYSLFFMVLQFLPRGISVGSYEHLVPFEFFLWIPIEALLLCKWGKTPGKWFLKTRLKQGKREKLDFMTALRRSFSVWFRGLGMWIPGINFFCLLIAYNKLKLLQMTSWDRDDHVVVTHYPIGRWRIYVAVFVALSGLFYYYSEKRVGYGRKSVVRSFDEHSSSKNFTARSDFSAESRCSYRCY
jgi:uncharacterized RDD family membrane protein YckC